MQHLSNGVATIAMSVGVNIEKMTTLRCSLHADQHSEIKCFSSSICPTQCNEKMHSFVAALFEDDKTENT